MKKLFLLLFVSMGYFFSSYGQEKLTFSKVIEVKDVDKTSIYIFVVSKVYYGII